MFHVRVFSHSYRVSTGSLSFPSCTLSHTFSCLSRWYRLAYEAELDVRCVAGLWLGINAAQRVKASKSPPQIKKKEKRPLLTRHKSLHYVQFPHYWYFTDAQMKISPTLWDFKKKKSSILYLHCPQIKHPWYLLQESCLWCKIQQDMLWNVQTEILKSPITKKYIKCSLYLLILSDWLIKEHRFDFTEMWFKRQLAPTSVQILSTQKCFKLYS